MKSITVFTPTYNRDYCLPILYASLLRQTDPDFEWLVIDDGSTDSTRELVQGYIDEGRIAIRYHYKPNGGMHTGHNTAYALIGTELNVCVDSDDYLPDNAIARILFLYRRDGTPEYAGIIGLDATPEGEIIGQRFPEDMKECRFSELGPKYKVFGDKKIVYRTEIVKKLEPYPEFEGERFTPLYFPIIVDEKYKLLCYNEVFCLVDYQADGSSHNIFAQYFRHPKGFSHWRKMTMIYNPFWKRKFSHAVHYVATSIISRNRRFLSESPLKGMTLLAFPFGVALYLYLLRKRNSVRDMSKLTQKPQ